MMAGWTRSDVAMWVIALALVLALFFGWDIEVG